MKKKYLLMLAGAVLASSLLFGCGTKEAEVAEEAAVEETSDPEADQAAADEVAALIDAIYVQTYDDDTYANCEAAKAAWDNLTDAQKALVEGENADPDYFGCDTGDASKDDALNADEIGDNEILVVSFGTSFNDSRVNDISSVEKAIANANPDWAVRRAFTSQIIINHIYARDGEKIDNMDQALDRAVANGVKNIVVVPTHLMHGAEYDELVDSLTNYGDSFESVAISEPLLGALEDDASVINDDKKAVANAVANAAAKEAAAESVSALADEGTALVLMGHGTSHNAKVAYSQMNAVMGELGFENVFVGTVEGEPEETACGNVIEAVKEKGYTKVILRPLMVVAGDHANNDMAGDDENSWKSMFEADGSFESVECQIAGLGEIPEVQDIYLAHVKDAFTKLPDFAIAEDKTATITPTIADGVYDAEFSTDSSMFHVNDALDGKGTLTVKDGEMTIHISLTSKNILNLYLGLAADAEKDGANSLVPTVDTVTYKDGTTEEVHGFDVPVPALDEEFDLALLGTKGTWYDHKVVVKNPVAQ